MSGLIALSGLLAQERGKLEKAQADNARLEAALPLLKEVMDWHSRCDSPEYNECDTTPCAWCSDAKKLLSGNSTALRDLLAPTITMLERTIADGEGTPVPTAEVDAEIARLRAVMEEPGQ